MFAHYFSSSKKEEPLVQKEYVDFFNDKDYYLGLMKKTEHSLKGVKEIETDIGIPVNLFNENDVFEILDSSNGRIIFKNRYVKLHDSIYKMYARKLRAFMDKYGVELYYDDSFISRLFGFNTIEQVYFPNSTKYVKLTVNLRKIMQKFYGVGLPEIFIYNFASELMSKFSDSVKDEETVKYVIDGNKLTVFKTVV